MLICENGVLVEVKDVIDAVAEGSEEDKLNKLAEGLSTAMSLAAVRSAAKQIVGGENG